MQFTPIGLPLKLHQVLDCLGLKNVKFICMEEEPHQIFLLVEECFLNVWLDHGGLVDRFKRAKVFLNNVLTEHWHQVYCIPYLEHF